MIKLNNKYSCRVKHTEIQRYPLQMSRLKVDTNMHGVGDFSSNEFLYRCHKNDKHEVSQL